MIACVLKKCCHSMKAATFQPLAWLLVSGCFRPSPSPQILPLFSMWGLVCTQWLTCGSPAPHLHIIIFNSTEWHASVFVMFLNIHLGCLRGKWFRMVYFWGRDLTSKESPCILRIVANNLQIIQEGHITDDCTCIRNVNYVVALMS